MDDVRKTVGDGIKKASSAVTEGMTYQNAKLTRSIKDDQLQELKTEKDELLNLIDEEREKYKLKMEQLENDQQAIVAFVLFKSEAWKEKAFKVFTMGYCEYFAYKFGKCFKFLK